MSNILNLGVGGLGFQFRFAQGDFAGQATAIYNPFVSAGKQDRLEIGVNLTVEAGEQKLRDLAVKVSDSGISATRTDFDARIDLEAGNADVRIYPTEYTDVSLDAFFRLAASVWAPKHDALLMHGASVEIDGKGYLFVGKSGAGKSTLSRLAKASRIRVLSDEISLVQRTGRGWMIAGTPFHGEESDAKNTATVPLKAVAILKKSQEMRIGVPRRGTELRQLMRHVLLFGAPPKYMARVFRLANSLLGEVGFKTMLFRPETDVWRLISDLA